jgi:ketosteroid isomerase-like protein
MPARNLDLLREGLAAIDRGDADWLIEHSDPALEMHMVGVVGEPVRYDGAEGIREWLRDMGENWQSFAFVPEDLRDLGDRMLAVVLMRARGRASAADVEIRQAIVIELRDERAVVIRTYWDVAQAFAELGLEQSD